MTIIKRMGTEASYGKYVRPSYDYVKLEEFRKCLEMHEKLEEMKKLPKFTFESDLPVLVSNSNREAIQIANSSKSSRFLNFFKNIGKFFKFVK